MNTKQLVAELADRQDLSKAETRRLLDGIVEAFTAELSQGKRFTLPELGTFEVKIKDEQRSYNPHYKKYMLLPPKRKVRFNVAKDLKEKYK